MAKITTIIDIGSNSVRMAVFERTSQFGFYLKFEQKSKVRISEGTYENGGMLQEVAISRTLEVLREFYKIASIYKSRKIICVATSAVRDAPNRSIFISRAKKMGIQIKVIDGQKEAYFGAIAVANLSHHKSGIMVDIGGGSTECAIIENGKIKDSISINLGTIRLKELFLDKNLDTKETKNFILKELKNIPSHFRSDCIFGVGGSIRALAKIILKQSPDGINLLHGFEINIKQHEDLIDKIIKAKKDRLNDFGINDERTDNIQGGLLVLSCLFSLLKSKHIVTCGVGVREGVFLHDLLRRHGGSFPNCINPALSFIKDKFAHDKIANKRKKIALQLFNLMQEKFGIKESYKELFCIASLLCQIGSSIDFYSTNRHSAYMSLHMLRYCLSHKARAIISSLIEFSDKKLPKDTDLQKFKMNLNLEVIQILSFALSIAKILQFSTKALSFSFEENALTIKPCDFLLKEKLDKLATPKVIKLLTQ
mgnify:CR=1 FL=1